MQVTAKHSEAVGQCPRIGMEEGFLFYGVALHTADIAPGNVQGSATVVANLANSGLAIRDRTAVPTGKTAHPVTVKFLVKLALADVLVDDIPQGRHILSPKSADFHPSILLKLYRKRPTCRACALGPRLFAARACRLPTSERGCNLLRTRPCWTPS